MALPPTLAKPKSLAEWRLKIVESLGGQGWNVDLTERNIDHAIYQTLALWSKYTPRWEWKPLGTSSQDVQEYDFSQDYPEGVRVVDVKFQRSTIKYYAPFHTPYLDEYRGLREPRRVYKLHVANDRHNMFLGANPTWRWDEERRKLIITAPSPFVSTNSAALLLIPWEISMIPYHQEYDFLNAAVGHAKIILGRVLGKFGPIPAAQGSIDLHGESLASEGRSEVKEVEEKLDRSLIRKIPPRSIF